MNPEIKNGLATEREQKLEIDKNSFYETYKHSNGWSIKIDTKRYNSTGWSTGDIFMPSGEKAVLIGVYTCPEYFKVVGNADGQLEGQQFPEEKFSYSEEDITRFLEWVQREYDKYENGTVSITRHGAIEYQKSRREYAEKKFGIRIEKSKNTVQKVSAEQIGGIPEKTEKVVDNKDKADIYYEEANKAIEQFYTICPLCGKKMEENERMECFDSEHGYKFIDFNENDNSVILSEIVTDKGEIIAQAICNQRKNVYILTGMRLSLKNKQGWKGEPFKSLKFKDFKKIIS